MGIDREGVAKFNMAMGTAAITGLFTYDAHQKKGWTFERGMNSTEKVEKWAKNSW